MAKPKLVVLESNPPSDFFEAVDKNKDLILFRDLVSYVRFALVIMIYRNKPSD